MVASTWLGDHQERPSAPTNSLHKLHMARYQVHQLQLQLLSHDMYTSTFFYHQCLKTATENFIAFCGK